MAFNKETDWIGVDLDGTLAKYEPGDYTRKGAFCFGEPIPAMVERVKRWLAQGIKVRIVTARHTGGRDWEHDIALRCHIENWTAKHLGQALEVTNEKNGFMHALYDDRAVAVESNTGRILGGERHDEDPEPLGRDSMTIDDYAEKVIEACQHPEAQVFMSCLYMIVKAQAPNETERLRLFNRAFDELRRSMEEVTN